MALFNRKRRNLALYVAALAGLGGAIAGLALVRPFQPYELAIVAVLLLIPGRIAGLFLRDVFRARRLIDRGRSTGDANQFATAVQVSERLLATLARQPWRRWFMLAFFGVYTRNVEAIALNNKGAALLEMGRLDRAERELRAALVADPGYAIPLFNLGVVAHIRGKTATGHRLIKEARRRGYRGSRLDKTVTRITSAYARVAAA